MPNNIERILRLCADFHNFCEDEKVFPAEVRDNELSLEELELIAAAGTNLWDLDEDLDF